MKYKPLPEFRELCRMLDYDPETGILRWKIRAHQRHRAGDIAGHINLHGYVEIGIRNITYQAHRLIWKREEGYDPIQIDHINGIRTDNRWENLRHATHVQNCMNANRRSDNSSGYKGVTWDVSKNLWAAKICIDKRTVNLGRFTTAEAAHCRYVSAAEQYFGTFAFDGEGRNSYVKRRYDHRIPRV